MRKFITKSALVVSAMLLSMALNAQVDVTDQYLSNADFETSPTFTESNGTANGTKVANGYEITGWTMVGTTNYNRSATAKYGITFSAIPDVLNSVNPPASDINGNSEGHVLMISGGWTSLTQFTQTVTLPAGKYELTFDVMNQNGSYAVGANYFGFIPDSGSPTYSTQKVYTNSWITDKVVFALNEETSGKISIGLLGLGSGSGTNAKLAVDNVKLTYYAASKTILQTEIDAATALVVTGSPGESYMQGVIAAAQAIHDANEPSVDAILQAMDNLDTAVIAYQNTSLSDLQVNGTTVKGFSATTLDYTYNVAYDSAVPTVSAVAAGAIAGANAVVADAAQIPGTTTITVIAGNGVTQEYTVKYIINYMSGWDANGATNVTPWQAGWRTTDPSGETLPWAVAGADASKYQYRDNLNVGRVFIHPHNTNIFSYPIEGLVAGNVYTFKCSGGKMSDNANRTITFAVNTSADGSGAVVGYQTKAVKQWNNGYENFQFTFMPATSGTHYMTWQTGNDGGTDRSFAWGFEILETADAITPSNIGSFSNGGLSLAQSLPLEGDFTADNITTLAAKLGTNDVLTTVDLTAATVAADATDIFATINPNAIKLFAAATAPADWTNVVVGNTAGKIEFTDGYPFDNSQTFTAATMTYNRTFASGWSTFCLPFGMDNISELGTVEEFDEVKEDNGTIAFKVATSIEAGKAYLINTEGEEIFSGSNVQFPLVEPTGDNAFKGTFSELTGTDAEGKLILVLDAENDNKETFMAATAEATIPAFRAYISLLAGRSYAIVHDNNGATSMENETANDNAELSVYTSNGSIIINATVAQQVTVSGIDGRLIQTIALSAGESTSISNLAAGIYLVNNQKVAVK